MNRLVIIGNGFDLAHGLPTGYCDFINWYWKKVCDDIKKQDVPNIKYDDDIVKVFMIAGTIFERNSLKDMLKTANDFSSLHNIVSSMSKFPKPSSGYPLKFSNRFFEEINNKNSLQNWVDIENEYYKLLKDCLEQKDNSKVRKLNKEFQQIKDKFEEYLCDEVCNIYTFLSSNQYNRFFNVDNIAKETFLKEFHFENHEDFLELKKDTLKISEYRTSSRHDKQSALNISNLFVNFNYTPTVTSYVHSFNSDTYDYYGDSTEIQIYGCIGSAFNKINFGFGDEMDDEYSNIEKKNDNEYLKFIKSFQYLQNSNYKKILEFINSQNFQVYIMGHSCGVSDRTLLNTIFEHENCKSIKIFYHKYSNPTDGESTDNYTELLQNISRHFNDKQLMRRRIVEKDLCEPLPPAPLVIKHI